MPAPIYKYGKQGKSYKNGRIILLSFYVKKILAGLSPPTMHIIIASIIHRLHWSLS